RPLSRFFTLFPYTTLFRSDPLRSVCFQPDVFIVGITGIDRRNNSGTLLDLPRISGAWNCFFRWLASNSGYGHLRFTGGTGHPFLDRKSTRLNSSHVEISYA